MLLLADQRTCPFLPKEARIVASPGLRAVAAARSVNCDDTCRCRDWPSRRCQRDLSERCCMLPAFRLCHQSDNGCCYDHVVARGRSMVHAGRRCHGHVA